METTIGLVGDGFVIVAADTNAARSIVNFKKDEDKVTVLDAQKVLGSAGSQARAWLVPESRTFTPTCAARAVRADRDALPSSSFQKCTKTAAVPPIRPRTSFVRALGRVVLLPRAGDHLSRRPLSVICLMFCHGMLSSVAS